MRSNYDRLYILIVELILNTHRNMEDRKFFTLESILNLDEFKACTYELPIVLGKTAVTNKIVIKDLVDLPHILVGGATGQGKSSALHGMITSLLRKKKPTELQLVLIDPKHYEFDKYASVAKGFLAEIPGICNPILTDCTEATLALKNLCDVMDKRFGQLTTAGVSNIQEYNAKYKNGDLKKEQGYNFMPYVVIVCDEFGDLKITGGKEVEASIIQLAGCGHRVGIHLIISTHRVYSNIISGFIKANFPARIAFRVLFPSDSMLILDQPGASGLRGKGDMIFYSSDEKQHVQGAFVDL